MTIPAAPRVAIIIVNYKGRDDTLDCLQSLQALTYQKHQIYVVDQASGDGTPDAIRASFPPVRVLENPVNDGFAGGNNLALRQALTDGADYLFLLNNDTTVAPNLLEPLIAEMERDPQIGMAGPLMLYHAEPDTIWALGGTLGPGGESVLPYQGEPVSTVPQTVSDEDFIVGCGLMVRRSVCETVGLMDERFFLYYEETDWCARVKRDGWRIVAVPTARLWHKVSRSTGTESELTLYYMRRNVLLYLQRNGTRSGYRAALVNSLRLALVWLVQGKRRRSRVLLQAVADAVCKRWGKTRFSFQP